MANASEVVGEYQQAMGKGDFATARKLLHDTLSFRGPIETFDSPEPYLESLKKLHHIIQRIDMKKIFADGDDVCVLYDMVTNTPAGTARINNPRINFMAVCIGLFDQAEGQKARDFEETE